MNDSRKFVLGQLGSDGEQTVVGALDASILQKARRSEHPDADGAVPLNNVPANNQTTSGAPSSKRSAMPVPPSQRHSDGSEESQLVPDFRAAYNGPRQAVASSEPQQIDDSEDVLTSVWRQDEPPVDPPSTPQRFRSHRQATASSDVTTARAIRLTQAHQADRNQTLVFVLGLAVGTLLATVFLVGLLLTFMFSGRLTIVP